MSLYAVGMSHHTAPMAVLDAASVSGDLVEEMLTKVRGLADEVVVLATCNRLEVYLSCAEDETEGLEDQVIAVVASFGSLSETEFAEHGFVYSGSVVAEHLFDVAAGLDSMVVGEPQVLGQVRSALLRARSVGSVGPVLSDLFDAALRVGKQVRTETGLQRAGGSIAAAALDLLSGTEVPWRGGRALVVGAGSMAALAGRALVEAGVSEVVVTSRTASSAAELAESLGGRAEPFDTLPRLLRAVDLVVTCAGTRGELISAQMLAEAAAEKVDRVHQLGVLDLAVPHDVDRDAAELDGVVVRGLEHLSERAGSAADERAARQIVCDALQGYAADQRVVSVTPTVVALRGFADQVVAAELERLRARTSGISEEVQGELETTVRRVVAKLLHGPTVRVKEAAGSGEGDQFEDAVRALFALPGGASTTPRGGRDLGPMSCEGVG